MMCFFQEVTSQAGAKQCASLSVYGGCPVYEDARHGPRIAFFYPGLGAPAAVVPELALGHAMVVDQALRDEGTSHHYLPPSRFVEADREVSQAIAAACERSGLAVGRGNSWTTDAIFRETRSRIDRRVEEGCSMVEMEASAFFAVGKHRGVRVWQLLYVGDTLAADDWDGRDWTSATQTRQALFDICLDAAASLTQG